MSLTQRLRQRRTQVVGLILMTAALLLATTGCEPRLPAGNVIGEPGSASTLVGCDAADTFLTVTTDTHLDPTCTYTQGIEVVASDVTLDCRGARIVDVADNRPQGIHVHVPVGQDLTGVVVRNCFIEGFTNTIRVSRDGFRSLPAGAEYLDDVGDITIENNHLSRSRGSGIFINAYVTGVTIRQNSISEAGSVGVYLEAGSRDSTLSGNSISHNGFATVKPEGTPENIGGTTVLTRQTGREGIAIDGSSGNHIVGNNLGANAAGGIFLYKNCGEYATQKPESWWQRRYGADDNLIEDNVILAGPTGIWVGSRMAENQYFMDCSDPAYLSGALTAVHLDHAEGNSIRNNRIGLVDNAIRVEDDATTVTGNYIEADDPTDRGILIGTKHRTEVLGRPVTGTVVTGNDVVGPDGIEAYGWVHGQESTTFADNTLNDSPATLEPGTQPTINPFLFVIKVWIP